MSAPALDDFAARLWGASTAYELNVLAGEIAGSVMPDDDRARLQIVFEAQCLSLWPRQCRPRTGRR